MAGPKLDPEILAHLEWIGYANRTIRCVHAGLYMELELYKMKSSFYA